MGFTPYGNCHCKAIRVHYGCAYAVLINMPIVLFFLFDHVTATGLTPSENRQLRKC